MFRRIVAMLFTRENLLAFALAVLLILVFVFGIDVAPTWIYQGF